MNAETPYQTELQNAPDHNLNAANLMTASRALLLGPAAAAMLARGDRGVSMVVAGMATSDAEGKVARRRDKRDIEKYGHTTGHGTTELGKSIDPIADTVSFLEIAGGVMASPRASLLGKTAVGIVLAQESIKSAWAIRADKAHRKAHNGEKLVLDVTPEGKRATGFKFAALEGAVLTHDLDPGKARTITGIGAIAAAVKGAMLGEKARRSYKKELSSKK